MNSSTALIDRAVISVSGSDSQSFLQGLITNDIGKLAPDCALYAALLTPQGKILFDFVLYEHESAILLDCAIEGADGLIKRLSLYRLRAKVEIRRRGDLAVIAVWGNENSVSEAVLDPRLAALGWRSVVPAEHPSTAASASAYMAHRLDLGVPEGKDFGHDTIFALDADLEELSGVAFDKGCYVGQELTARMKHRGTARKRLLPIQTDQGALPPPGTPVVAGGREIGTVMSIYGNRGFALMRLDCLGEVEGLEPEARGISVRVTRPAWLLS